MNTVDILLSIFVYATITLTGNHLTTKFKHRKEKRYYAFYVNDVLVDFKPLIECKTHYESLVYKSYKRMGIDDKKRIVNIGVDYEIQ